MNDLPFVSIIVAAYNAERSIGRCINSLLALDYPEYEIIVIDNNSQDKTAEIIHEYKVKYLIENKKGWPAARNTGIEHSSAKFVANIDADCFASPDWINKLMIAFKGDHLACVVGKTLVEEGNTLTQRYYSHTNPFFIEHKIGNTEFIPWGGGNNLMLRKAFLDAGGYDSNRFTSGADAEFHHRLENQFDYKTIYESSAIVYHEARGSIREFFTVSSKYAYDGLLRSMSEEMKDTKKKYELYFVRKSYQIMLNTIGGVYRGIKALFGKESWFRVFFCFFSIISLTGTIYGYSKGRLKILFNRDKSYV